MVFLFAAIGACWRRFFGTRKGIANVTRFWKYLILAIVVLAMYYTKSILDWKNWRMYATIFAFMYHWSRSHGDYFYIYYTGKDEGRIRWIDRLLRKIYGVDGYYNFKGNCTGLFLRYTATACLVAAFIPNARFIFSGLLTTIAYAATGKVGTGKKPVQTAEWFSGAFNFALLYLCI